MMESLSFLVPEESTQVWIGLNIILAWSFYIILSTGQISLGNAAFMALGAYSSGVATMKFGLPLFSALLLSILVGVFSGMLVGFPALRVRGIYLAMMTIGVQKIVEQFFRNTQYFGGPMGLKGLKGVDAWMVFVAVAVIGLFIWKLESTRLGRSFSAVRDDEMVASTMGLNVTYIKVMAFAIGAAMASLAGGLYGHYMYVIAPDHFDIWQSFLPTFYVIFGGMHSFWGSAFGAVVLTVLPEYFRGLQEWRIVVYGSAIVVMMMFRPQGLITRNAVRRIAEFIRALLPKRPRDARKFREAAF